MASLFATVCGVGGVDTGYHAADIPGLLGGASWRLPPGEWIRLREMAPPGTPSSGEETGLGLLQGMGLRVSVLQRWPADSWKSGVGTGAGVRLPLDLREAFAQSRQLAAAYGKIVDAWEIDNEPDLGFVPDSAESYTAFLKASYLGFKAGMAEAQNNAAEPGNAPNPDPQRSQRAPLVLMGALGLPPGPWLERFAANDGFAYTDGYNYHYYGYAEDFTGVYGQHEAAFHELGVRSLEQRAHSSKLIAKSYPIFLSEIGYGMLGKRARDTKEGRLRQWRWFKTVGEQVTALHIEAPMAFLLPPYLEHDANEFGLTVPAVQETGNGGQSAALATDTYWSGGIQYEPGDFGAMKAESWMKLIGKQIAGNEVTPALAGWLAVRGAADKSGVGRVLPRAQSDPGGMPVSGSDSRPWTVTVPSPSPVVIDFISGEGLSFVKRYNGSFVVARTPVVTKAAEEQQPRPKPSGDKTLTPPPRTEEFMIHVRTATGNLYEVYPTRQATPEWHTYLEPRDNFTMSFYGRAELPWRFKDNKPASLVVVMYPKQLPATYEFRSAQLIRMGQGTDTRSANDSGKSLRYGAGKVVLYNFSDKPVAGWLALPAGFETEAMPVEDPGKSRLAGASGMHHLLILAPGERREVPVTIKVPWGKYERIEAPVTFTPDDPTVPPARFLTAFLPDIGGLNQTVVGNLLQRGPAGGVLKAEAGRQQTRTNNRSFVVSRSRATEEATVELTGDSPELVAFAQRGAQVERTGDGFIVTVTALPPGKERRVEIEIPWPDGVEFEADEFLTMEFRLKM
ncbi:MAG TPA: hypothetical protein VGD88_07685 [Opitutaceae bacterium]